MHAPLTPPQSSPGARFFSPMNDIPDRDPPSPCFLRNRASNDTLDVRLGSPGGKRSDFGIPADNHEDYATQTVYLPPVIHHLSASSKRARSKFTPYNRPPGPSALELRFTEKSLGRVDSSEITLEDARKGRSVFLHGLMGLSDKAMRQALEARRADRESKRLRALSTAWEIEASDRHRNFLVTLHEEEVKNFHWTADEVAFFEKVLERRSLTELENNMDFNIGVYGQDLRSLSVVDERIDLMEEEATRRGLGRSPSAKDDTSDRLNSILAAAILAESDETEGASEDGAEVESGGDGDEAGDNEADDDDNEAEGQGRRG